MNGERDPAPGPAPNPFRERFGGKARDPASIGDAIHRDEPRAVWEDFWDYRIHRGLIFGPVFALAAFAITLAQNDDFATYIPSLWFGWCLLLAPIIVWGVLMRQAPGDVPVTVAALALGAAPGAFFLPGSWSSQMPVVMVTFPLLLTWGAAGHVLALNQGLVARWPAARGTLLVGGGLVCAAGAAGLFATVAFGWSPP